MTGERPVLLLAIRHGESEGNWAHALEKAGDNSAILQLRSQRHETNFRLTDFGRWQLEQTGLWLQETFPQGFNGHFCSDTVRGRESAAYLSLPRASWTPLSLLRERDSREFQAMTETEREELTNKLSGALLDSPYYFHPLGEAPADLIDHRVSPMLERVSGKNLGSVIWVCHGDWLRCLKARLWHLTKDEWKELYTDMSPEGMILNGTVHMYSRMNPEPGGDLPSNLLPYYGWFRSYCPWNPEHESNTPWTPIERRSFSNSELIDSTTAFQQIVNHEKPDTFESLAADGPGSYRKVE